MVKSRISLWQLNFVLLFSLVAQVKSTWNEIPAFDFNHNDLTASAVSSSSVANSCTTNTACVGYNIGGNYGYYKNALKSPYSTSGYNFYVTPVSFNMIFAQVNGWDSIGNDIRSIPTSGTAMCAYECTITFSCVGAVWDKPSNYCYLKSAFVGPTISKLDSNAPLSSDNIIAVLLLPMPVYYTPATYTTCRADVCVQSIPYNIIPNFDFRGNDINNLPGNNLQEVVQTDCTGSCIGFNSQFWYKKNFGNPTIYDTGNYKFIFLQIYHQ